MSRMPGLGINYFRRYLREILDSNGCHLGEGFFSSIPRYYLKILEKDYPLDYKIITSLPRGPDSPLKLVQDDPVGYRTELNRRQSAQKRLSEHKSRPLEYY